MELCSNDHDEICYEGSRCPVCDLVQEIVEKKEEIERLEKDIEKLENAE